MNKSDKLPPKKRLTKISVDSSTKITEFKLASALLAKNGSEFLVEEHDRMDIFEAVSQLIFSDKKPSQVLRQHCLVTLQHWSESSNPPSDFKYISKIKPFLDFYSVFPNCVFFEGVT